MGTKQFFTIAIFLFSINSFAKTYFVATDGNDSYSGLSKGDPFLTITKSISVAVAGDIIYVRAGTYVLTATISIGKDKNGSEGNIFTLMGYPGEAQPLLDFSTQAFGSRGISLSGSYWYIKALRIKGSGDNGIYISGSNNTIEFCSFFENRDSGMQLSGGASNNKIINCDSYYNADPTDYGDADGFAVKMDVGTGNYFYGCRSWLNVDDGWDGYMRGADDVTTTLENCWTSWNGYFKDGTDAGAAANGNGFKMGGSDNKDLKHNFILKNCLGFNNKAKNFDQNNNLGSMTLYNCTSFGGAKAFSIPSALAAGKTATLVNCVYLNGTNSLGSFVVQTTNGWQSPFSVTAADFASIDTSETYKPRFEDGSLPNLTFMHLVQGSDLINSGTDVGIAFIGAKPDLGFWEYGTPDNNGIPLFIGDIQNKESLKIFPTMADDRLFLVDNLNSSAYIEINVFSITGQKQMNIKLNGPSGNQAIELNVSKLPAGLYICQLSGNGKSLQGRFIKK